MKRILRAMLSLVLCLTLMSVVKISASADTTELEFWRVKVGTVELSDGQCIAANGATEATAGDNGGSYVAYFKDGTLYLNNLTLSGQIVWYARNAENSAISFDLTLDLTGTNTITNTNGSAILGETGWVTGRGMSLIITGSGSLNVTGKNGMWVWRNITIQGNATVTATGTNGFGIGNNADGGVITVAGNAVVTASGSTYGVAYDNHYSDSSVKVTGGSLTASGNTAAFRQENLTMGTGVSAQAGTATDGSNPEAYNSANLAGYKWYQSAYTPPTYFTVSFDANGGTGSMTPADDVLDDYTLPANGFTAPDGMKFKAWSVNGSEKQPGETITVSTNTTVTAVWEPLHTCVIEPVAKVEPSCTSGGKNAYYKCDGCGKFYEDAQGATEIADIASWGNLDATGHDETDWLTDKDNHWKECNALGCVISDDTVEAHKDTNADGKCDICLYDMGAAANQPSNNGQSPKTGENSGMILWIALLMAGGLGFMATTAFGKKRLFSK